jgi:hypothetical protein
METPVIILSVRDIEILVLADVPLRYVTDVKASIERSLAPIPAIKSEIHVNVRIQHETASGIDAIVRGCGRSFTGIFDPYDDAVPGRVVAVKRSRPPGFLNARNPGGIGGAYETLARADALIVSQAFGKFRVGKLDPMAL